MKSVPVFRHRMVMATAASLAAVIVAATGGTAIAVVPGPFDAVAFGEVGTAIGDGTTSDVIDQTAVDFTGTDLDGASLETVSLAGTIGGAVALTTDGRVLAWGLNYYGEVGDGTTTAQPRATFIDTAGTALDGKTVTQIAASASSVFALTSDGSIVTWGTSRGGSLGLGATTEAYRPTEIPTAGSPLEGKTLTGLFPRTDGAFVQASDGSLYGWGRNGDVGTLVPGGAPSYSTPVAVQTTGSALEGKMIAQAVALPYAAGTGVTDMVLTTEGELISWGDDLGIGGQPGSSSTPAAIPALAGVVIEAVDSRPGEYLVIARSTSGRVYTWGKWAGQNSTDPVREPTLLDLPLPATEVASSNGAGYALMTDGTLYAWGDGSRGQLGGGVQDDALTPVPVPTSGTPLDGANIVGIATFFWGIVVYTSQAAVVTPVDITAPENDSSGTALRPQITGTGEPGSTVTIADGPDTLGTAEVDPDGAWTFTPTTDLRLGEHTLTATQDADLSTASVTITIDAAAIVTPVNITAPADGSSGTALRPQITGTGEPGSTVTLTDGPDTLGTAEVDPDGAWTFTPTTDLRLGEHTLTATQDADLSTASVTITINAAVVTPGPDPTGPPVGPDTTDGRSSRGLAFTGSDALPLSLAAGLLLAAGIGLMVLRSRRSNRNLQL